MVEADTIIKWFIRRTTKQNRNAILAVQGSPGSGKSYSCLRIMERVHEELGVEGKVDVRNCCRDLIEFMERLNSKDMYPGCVLVLEEVGVNMSSKEWQSKINRLINHVIQTFRDKNLIILLNLPDLRMLDSDTRRLLHGVVTMKGINHSAKTSSIAIKLRQHNFESLKDYWKFPRKKVKGKQIKVKKMTLKKPTEELIKIYEKRRSEFTALLNDRVQKEIGMSIKKRDDALKEGTGLPWSEFQEKILALYRKGITKQIEIAKILGRNQGIVSQNFRFMDKKNPDWRKPLEKVENQLITVNNPSQTS